MAEYVSHVDAYERTTALESKENQNSEKKEKYAKILAYKRSHQANTEAQTQN
jgi:hypothetical protein